MILLIYNTLFFCGGGVHTIFSCVHFHAASAERGRERKLWETLLSAVSAVVAHTLDTLLLEPPILIKFNSNLWS